MNAQGQTYARDLKDGSIVWTVADKGRVVHCDEKLVLTAHATAKGLTIHGLAARDGKEQWTRTSKLPSWVNDSNLNVKAWTDREGYGVAWSAMTYWQGGCPPSPAEERAASRDARGAFVFSPGGGTRQVSGAPSFQGARVPAAIQEELPDSRGVVTWDGAHARFATGDGTRVVHLESKARRSLPVRVSAGFARLYVTRHGLAILLSSSNERGEDQSEYHVLKAQCWDRQGRATWSAELYRQVQIPPVP